MAADALSRQGKGNNGANGFSWIKDKDPATEVPGLCDGRIDPV